jgi:hypothetical protein
LRRLALATALGLLLLYPERAFPGTGRDNNQLSSPAVEARQPSLGQSSPSCHPKTWRAFLEEAILLTSSTIDYWFEYSHFTVDWQFTWKTFGRKFFTAESPRLDSNAFWFNWSHALAGAGYYNMARTNGLNSRVATLFSLGSSALWETVSEWRELISLNDMVFSSMGGPAIGEPLFQVSSVLSHGKGLLSRLASFVFNPFLFANNWFDLGHGPAPNSDAEAAWHRYRLVIGLREDKVSPAGSTAAAQAGTSYRQFHAGLDMETNSVPGYAKAETFSRFLSGTLSSRIFFDMDFSSFGLEEFNIRTQAVLFGYGRQSALTGSDGKVRGNSFSVGYGSAFEVFKKRAVAWYDGTHEVEGGGLATAGNARFMRPTPTQFTDKLAVISPLGAVFKLSRFGPRLHVRWTSEVSVDLAMVNALAYNRYTESHDPGGVKSTLLNWGYYYALGMTLATDAAADLGQWRLQGALRYQWYDSIEGLDRYQYLGLVADDFDLRDSRLFWRFRLAFHLPRTPIEMGLAAEGIGRRGSLLDIREHYREHRVYYQLAVVF